MSARITITSRIYDGNTYGELVMDTSGPTIMVSIGPGRIALDNADDLRVLRGAIDAAIAIVEARNGVARRDR